MTTLNHQSSWLNFIFISSHFYIPFALVRLTHSRMIFLKIKRIFLYYYRRRASIGVEGASNKSKMKTRWSESSINHQPSYNETAQALVIVRGWVCNLQNKKLLKKTHVLSYFIKATISVHKTNLQSNHETFYRFSSSVAFRICVCRMVGT